MSAEEWRPVPGFPGYEVSDQGRVLSRQLYHGSTAPRLMSAPPNEWGYPSVHLTRSSGDRVETVHSLVLLAFVGERPEGMVIRHLDGNPSNNNLANLRYGTASENTRDQLRHNTHGFASRTHCKHGHEYTPENTSMQMARGVPYRQCKTCNRARVRRYRARRVGAAA